MDKHFETKTLEIIDKYCETEEVIAKSGVAVQHGCQESSLGRLQ